MICESISFVKIFVIVLILSAGTAFAQNKVVVVPLGKSQKPSDSAFTNSNVAFVTSTPSTLLTITMTPQTDGIIIANSSAQANENTLGHEVRCSITTGTTIDLSYEQQWDSPGGIASNAQLAGTRGFDVTADTPITINLVCDHVGGAAIESSQIRNSSLTAIFIPK